jgi:hypothetical protein
MKSMHPLLKCLLLLIAFSNLAHAFYDPGQGRWVSRDPIGEVGGKNLYVFVENDAICLTDHLGLFNQNAEKKCEFVISGGHAGTNWERIDSGEDENLGRLRCVGCHANRQNQVTGTTSNNGWRNNLTIRPEEYHALGYSQEQIEQIRRDRERRGVNDDDLLDYEDTHNALARDFYSEKQIAETEGCRCCEHVTIRIECESDFQNAEKALLQDGEEALCGTTWKLDCRTKNWSKQ